MGFRRSKRNWKRHNERRDKSHPKLALVGAIVLAIGILLIFNVADVKKFDYATIIGASSVLVGTLMLLLSLSKRNQIRLAKGMDKVGEAFKDQCQCCKCQNCDRSHNHWVHDDGDARRRHY